VYYRKDGQCLRTKIVATIGRENTKKFDTKGNPCQAVKYEKLFEWFVQPGIKKATFMVDVLRLNMAFYTSDKETSVYERIFQWLEEQERTKDKLSRNIGILCDLAGAKTRLGAMCQGETKLENGESFQLSFVENKEGTRVGASVLAYGKPLSDVDEYTMILGKLKGAMAKGEPKQGVTISIGDGKTILRAINESNGILDCVVEKAGAIKSGQGVTFEAIDLGLPSFKKADQEALDYLLNRDKGQGFLAYIGVSFVREAEDILQVRQYVENYFINKLKYSPQDARGCCPDIIAKIETKRGADNIDEILDVADGIMVARGDLALQIGHEDVPERQKEIIRLCNRRGKVVITATEMLASMEDNPKPTRAEVNDVFNAIHDGTDAVMLSGETASGSYPGQAVDYMARIAEKAELYFEQKLYARGSSLNAQRFQELRRCSEKLIKTTNQRMKEKRVDYRRKQWQWAVDLYGEKLGKSEEQRATDRICEAGCELAEEKEWDDKIIQFIFFENGKDATVAG